MPRDGIRDEGSHQEFIARQKLQYKPQENVIFHFARSAAVLLFFLKIQTRPLTLEDHSVCEYLLSNN